MTVQNPTLKTLEGVLRDDNKVKVAGIDVDGVLRGKIISKKKFLSTAEKGFGFSSAIFGWDMHDELYSTELAVCSKETGYGDFIAIPDLSSFRRIPWEDNIAFFLLDFHANDRRLPPCPRGLMKTVKDRLAENGIQAMSGVELEFVNYVTPRPNGYPETTSSESPNLANFLKTHLATNLQPLTEGMFCYSALRPSFYKDYFYAIYNNSEKMGCGLEGWHTESGPGAYEAALEFCAIQEMADRVTIFKFIAKSLGIQHGITPNFMAKPAYGLPGNSGHVHVSLCDRAGNNLFARTSPDNAAPYPDLVWLSETGRSFLAGLLEALPQIMVLLAPTINSYKRLVESFWAPVFMTWGLEDRNASLRLITPPTCKPAACRIEVRIPGADMNPHYALAAIVLAGWRGVEKKMDLTIPPMSLMGKDNPPTKLPDELGSSVALFAAKGSIARDLFGDDFVDHFAATRRHEIELYKKIVTDWEVKRYIETV